MRLDKWLKNSRLIKRRTVANGRAVKASYEVKPGDVLSLTFGERTTTVKVLSVQEIVGKAGAEEMYEEMR